MSERRQGKIDRREFLRIAGIAGIGLVGAACTPAVAPTAAPTSAPTRAPSAATPSSAGAVTPAASKPVDVIAQIYEAAKKEGTLNIYSTGTSKDMDTFRQAFSKTYPGVEIKDWQGTGEQVAEKLLTEFRAGKVNADVVRIPLEQWVVINKGGVAEKWDNPEKINYSADAFDPNGTFVVVEAVVHVIAYNTQLVPAAKAPKKYQDLLDPVFKGKLGLEQEAYSWFTQRIKIWGKDKATEYARALAAQQPKFIKGNTAVADAVVSGEIWAAVNTYQHRVEDSKSKGAPVKWVVDEPTGAEPSGVGVAKGAPHPNAGKLMAVWMASKEGQDVSFQVLKRYSVRKDASIPADLKVNVQVPSAETIGEISSNQQLFKQIFGLLQ